MKKAFLLCYTGLLMLIFISMSPFSAAQYVQTLPVGVSVHVPDAQETLPGQFVTYSFTLTNTDSKPVSLTLDFKTEHGWTLLANDQSITIDPHSDYPVPVTIAVPAHAVGGESERLVLEITHGAQKWSVHVDTRIAMVHKIAVNGPLRGEAEPDQVVDYPIIVVNQGSQVETLSLSSISGQGWSTRVDLPTLIIHPGEKHYIHLYHTAPVSAAAGTADRVTLTITPSGDGSPISHTILTTVIESRTPKPVESLIPLRSSWLWEMTSPTQYDSDPALRWIYNLNGTLQPDYSFDFYINGNYETGAMILPDSIHLTLISPDNLIRFGRVDPLWTGVLPLPTQTAALSMDHYFKNQWRMQWLVGTDRSEDNFTNDRLSWLALTGRYADSPWSFRILTPTSSQNDPDYLAEVDYAVKFGRPQNSWSFRARLGGGNSNGFKHAGDLWLAGYGDRWSIHSELSDQDGFFDEDDQRRYQIYGTYRFSPNLAWEWGLTQWRQNEWADPTDPVGPLQSSKTIWTRFNLWRHYSIAFYSMDENDGIDPYQQSKVELRYFYHLEPFTSYFTLQWMNPDYETGPDLTQWSLDGQLKYAWGELHYWDNQFHYDLSREDGTAETEWSFSYRMNYSYPLSNTWSFISSAELERTSDVSLDNTFTLREELAFHPAPDIQWRISVYNVFSDINGSNLTLYLFYQRQFLSFARSPWSGVEGVIFEDLNGNGRLDPEDPLIEGIGLTLDEKKKIRSGSNGRWSFGMIAPGKHRLDLDLGVLPYFADISGWNLQLERGMTERIYIPVRRKLYIRGTLFIDNNQDHRMDNQDSALPGIKILLFRDGQMVGETSTGADGYYSFEQLLPGHYQLRVVLDNLPPDIVLPVHDQDIELNAVDSAPSFDWALTKKEKDIEFTFDSTESTGLEEMLDNG